MNQITISYWDQRGLIEPIKLILEVCQIPYKFEKIENNQYGTQKWQSLKHQLLKINPFVNLPYLIDQDQVISESLAIMNYIIYKSNRLELLGITDQQKIQCQTIINFSREFNWDLVLVSYESDYHHQIQNVLDVIRNKLSILEQHLSNNDYKYLVGNNETIADLICYENLQHVLHHDQNILNGFQRLQLFIKNIESIEYVNQYLKSDRFQKYPFNSPLRATKP